MRMLDIDKKDIKDMKPITLKKAKERVREGKSIVCQNERDFFEVTKEYELANMQRLEKCGVYPKLGYYIR